MRLIEQIRNCKREDRLAFVARGIVFLGLIYNLIASLIYAAMSYVNSNGEGVSADIPYVFFTKFLRGWTFSLNPIKLLPLIALLYLLIRALYKAMRRVSEKRHSAPEEAARSEKNIHRTLFLLSFLPFAAFLVYCVITMFTGAKKGYFMGGYDMLYGFEAFRYSFGWGFLSFCIIPVFPAMLIYQIVYIVRSRRAKKAAPACKS